MNEYIEELKLKIENAKTIYENAHKEYDLLLNEYENYLDILTNNQGYDTEEVVKEISDKIPISLN